MKKSIALLALLASSCSIAAYAADSSATGWISDAMCGAKHAGTGAACAKKCIQGGEKAVFVDAQSKEVWAIDNPDTVKDYAGSHVTIHGTIDKAGKSVHIASVAEAK